MSSSPQPTLLAIETSAATLSVAVQRGEQIFARHLHVPRRQSTLAVPTIAEVLEEAAVSAEDLDAIAFGRGPGSFTGIRVATAVAQGIGLAAEVVLIPVSSMACLAQAVMQRTGIRDVLVCLDARLGEVYWGFFSAVDGLAVLQGEECVDLPTAVSLPQDEFAIVGSAMQLADANLDKIRSTAKYVDPTSDPDARCLLELASQAWIDQKAVGAHEAVPVYLRNRVVSG